MQGGRDWAVGHLWRCVEVLTDLSGLLCTGWRLSESLLSRWAWGKICEVRRAKVSS